MSDTTAPLAAGATVGRETARVRGSSEEDFTEYLSVRQPALLRTAYLLTGDLHHAEDVLQTALAKLYLRWDRIRDPNAVDAYVRRALVNETTSLWRRAWKRHERPTDQMPDMAAHHDAYDEGTAGEVWDVVRSLPPRARAVVVLRYYEQLSEAETAAALGVTVGTVKSQASRAMRTLRERVPEHLHPQRADGSPSTESQEDKR